MMGEPLSHGCIRMRNLEVAELFDLVGENALVYISEHALDSKMLKGVHTE